MTRITSNITNVYAMSKGFTEVAASTTAINTTATSVSNYSGNFLEKATYNTPLNPLLVRGAVTPDMADFTTPANVEAINSYEIHKADNVTLTNIKTGIYNSNGGFTDATCDYNNDPTITHDANASIIAGLSVSGTGIPAGATISSITDSTHFELSASTTGGSVTNGTLTFTIQTYSAVNRIYPNEAVVDSHLKNKQTTKGNVLQMYDYGDDSGQRMIHDRTLLNEVLDATETVVTVGSATDIIVDDVIIVDNEEMLVTVVSSNDLTVIRGYNNTTATTHLDNTQVFERQKIDSLWVLVYSDDANSHHFAKVTEVLEFDVFGDAIEFSPSIGVDIPKDTKFAIFSSEVTAFPKTDSDNQTLVACGYGLLGGTSTTFTDATCDYNDGTTVTHDINSNIVTGLQVTGTSIPANAYIVSITNTTSFILNEATTGGSLSNQTLTFSTKQDNRHYLNTHVSRPFFYFLNGKDRLEPATRYILRTSSFDGTNHTYTYSTFLTEPAYSGDIIDYGPYTMEASLVDMLYKADNPAAMDFLEYTSDYLQLTNGSPDTILLDGGGSNDASFDNSITDLDGTEGTNWGLLGILRDSRFTLSGAQAGIYCIDNATDSTATTLTMDAADFGGVSTSDSLIIRFLAHAVDLDHNEMYGAFSSADATDTIGGDTVGYFAMVNAFRMGNRPDTEDATTYYGYKEGHTRYMHYTDSPLTNNLAPNMLEMIDYESVTTTGGYVDMVFADTQKILAKKIKQGDVLQIHQVVSSEEVGLNRLAKLSGTFEYDTTLGTNQILVKNLGNNEDIRFLLESSIPNSQTDTSSQFDPLFDAFTIDVSGTLYHFVPDRISNVSSNTQTITVKSWRKDTDTEFKTTTLQANSVPNFTGNAYRKRYSFLADNIMTSEIPIDCKINGYSLDYNGASAVPTNRNVTSFENLLDVLGTSLKVGNTILEGENESRINDINLVFKGGQMTGHRIKISYGDAFNSFIKLQTHLKDERFLDFYNKTDYKPFSDRLSGISLYNYPINSGLDGAGSLYRYNLNSPWSVSNTHIRGINSYIDYFQGTFDIENKVFSGFVESVEQVIEDGMFKLRIRGRNNISKLLGPIVNKDYKFTEDIIYSTVGPIENMAHLGKMDYFTGISEGAAGSDGGNGVYEVGSTSFQVDTYVSSLLFAIAVNKGDLLFSKEGTLLGRIHAITAGSNTYRITVEEGIPVRMKNGESIFITKQTPSTDITPDVFEHQSGLEMHYLAKRSNTVSFAKAMSSNPFISIRVNSLSGTSNKGIIFTGGNSLTDTTDGAPALEGGTLVGTSSSSHKLAKGYSIHSPSNIYFDLPFYCNLADEITDKHVIDFTNLNTVNSLTEYDILNLSSKEGETIIEIAPICPAILARVDSNELDGRDKYLRLAVETATDVIYSVGYNGPIHFTAAASDNAYQNLMVGNIIFKSDGIEIGKIIDISRAYTETSANDDIVITLDKPLTSALNSGEDFYKYQYHNDDSSYTRYHYNSGGNIKFKASNNATFLGDTYMKMNVIYSADTTDIAFFQKLKTGMRIEIQGATEGANNGVFTIGKYYVSGSDYGWYVFPRKMAGTNYASSGLNNFKNDTTGDQTCTIKILTDHFTHGMYFLNTQGLSQGGVLTLTNPLLSSPNFVDNICKPIRWAGSLFHYITDESLDIKSGGVARYNPNASTNTIYSDFIDRYGNTKWRYFGLQKGQSLSYINRRRKDGQIKNTYAQEKGKVNGYATAYRIADAIHGSAEMFLYPYGYHNNDFSWGVSFYDALHTDYVDTYNFLSGYQSGVSASADSDNIRFHPYFLEYLSPESRDFRPVMGSNFADLDKHGTWLTSPNTATSSNYNTLNVPRYMPRLHDNFRGGDWQEDMEAPENPDDDSIATSSAAYSDVKKVTNINFNLDNTGSRPTLEFDYNTDHATSDNTNRTAIAESLYNNWVKIGGTTDRNNNRAFYLTNDIANFPPIRRIKFSSPDSYGATLPPYTDFIDVNGSATNTTGTSLSNHTTVGAESITTLYPPWIGPKVDGITRAKDHWELPDPKTMRWFIFSPSDMFPDSMARQNHIGYSETIDSTAIARKFTDYNLLLKGESSKSQSGVLHEYYEGSLDDEYETDDNYETLPITEASITPSQIKRFGLMRLIDCTYDWHFNLIDPERLPDNMEKLTTPNFQYTRYQALRKTMLYAGDRDSSYDDSYSTMDTTDEDGTAIDPTGQVLVGDNIFTYHGKYLGTVTALDSSNKKITVVQRIELPQIRNSGESYQYRGPLYVCGDATLATSSQDREDSYYQFHTKGRGGLNTFTEVDSSVPTNMLQMMINASYHKQHITQTDYQQVPYGAITGASGATGTAIIYDSTNLDQNISACKFLSHFNENFSAFHNHGGIDSLLLTPTVSLPPAFQTFYSKHTVASEPEKTINVMQSKEYLVNKTEGSATNNGLATEYSHVSNILQWIQDGGNPYWNCDVVSLARYNIENSNGIQVPIGGKIKIRGAYILGDDSGTARSITTDFPYSKPARTGTPTGVDLAKQKYGDGFGGLTSAYGNVNSGEYSFLATHGYSTWGFATYNADSITADTTYFDSNYASYVADGIFGAFIPNLYLRRLESTEITDGTVSETSEGTIIFDSINGNTKMGIIRIEIDATSSTNDNPFLNFVDLTGMYLVANVGYMHGHPTASVDYRPFRNNGVYDEISYSSESVIFNPSLLNIYENDGLFNTSMNDAMVDPKHILYVHEHRRNVTGKVVAHELLIDNIPINSAGIDPFFADNYRIMRPAEHCFWKDSPTEIKINTLSSQTTKMPQENNMYKSIPSLTRVNQAGEFSAGSTNDINYITGTVVKGKIGKNEAVMSMYVAIDMDSRHAQHKTLTGTVSITKGTYVVAGSSTLFTTELQVGDMIKLSNQNCYIKEIASNTALTLASKFVCTTLSGATATLWNNKFTVLRDYIHLFNPTGNRNTFKSGSAYTMLLTDGISKQKMSMSVEADYWDSRALCKLSLGTKFENDMLGIVSFGEVFILKSATPSKINNAVSARIGSTVIIGSEVEDVINDLLSSEDIEYNINDDREYPYYISPNYQGIDIFSASNFAARYKNKEIRIDETGIALSKQSRELDLRPIELSYEDTNLKIITVTRNTTTFDLYNEVIVYGNGIKSIKRNRKSIDKFGKKTLEDTNMGLISQDDVDSRALSLLKAHSEGDDRFTVKMSKTGIEFVKAGDIITLDFPTEGIPKGQYKVYEIRRQLAGLIELEIGTYRKDLADRFAELMMQNRSNTASIRGDKFKERAVTLDFFDSFKIKELRLLINRVGLAETDAFTLGFQTDSDRLLGFGATMGPLETVTETLIDEDFL